MRKDYKQFLLSGILGAAILVNYNSYAAELEIKNDGSGEIDIIVEGGTGTIGTNKNIIKRAQKAGGTTVLKVEKETFGGETFSITGKSNIPSTNNKCELLLVEKDYKILFIEGKAGMLICKSVEK